MDYSDLVDSEVYEATDRLDLVELFTESIRDQVASKSIALGNNRLDTFDIADNITYNINTDNVTAGPNTYSLSEFVHRHLGIAGKYIIYGSPDRPELFLNHNTPAININQLAWTATHSMFSGMLNFVGDHTNFTTLIRPTDNVTIYRSTSYVPAGVVIQFGKNSKVDYATDHTIYHGTMGAIAVERPDDYTIEYYCPRLTNIRSNLWGTVELYKCTILHDYYKFMNDLPDTSVDIATDLLDLL